MNEKERVCATKKERKKERERVRPRLAFTRGANILSIKYRLKWSAGSLFSMKAKKINWTEMSSCCRC